jgi:hypothetical protein
MPSIDSLKTRRDLSVGRKKYAYYSLKAAEEAGLAGISRLPRSIFAPSPPSWRTAARWSTRSPSPPPAS